MFGADPTQRAYLNNDNSHLEGAILAGEVSEFYAYDHLNRRVVKQGLDTVVYHYDLQGNLIAESRADGTILREWVYVNGQRLAMILPAPAGGGGGCEAPPGPSYPSCSSLAARPGADAGAGTFLLLLGPAFIVIGLKYHRRKYTILGLIFTGGVLFLVLMPQAQSQTPAETIYYYHNDHLGTPRILTDQTGAVVWDVDYAPFGEISAYVTNSLPTDQPFRFPGQYSDQMTGLYYNWNRYYMPEVGRYNRVDLTKSSSLIINNKIYILPVNDAFNSIHPYSYSNSNPLINIDFNGLFMLYICFISSWGGPIPSNWGDTSSCDISCKGKWGPYYCNCDVTGDYDCYPFLSSYSPFNYQYKKHYRFIFLAQYRTKGMCPVSFLTSKRD